MRTTSRISTAKRTTEASWQGGWGEGTPIGGYSAIRGVRAKLARDASAWSVLPGRAAGSWISVEQQGPGSDFIQIGYAKGDGLGCDNGSTTSGDVKTFIEAIFASGTFKCHLGQVVSPSEAHDLRLQRCSDSTDQWCGYVDGNLLGSYSLNFASGNLVKAREEFNCQCSNVADNTSAEGTFFGGSVPFSVTSSTTSGSNPWADVTPGNATKTDFPAGDWAIDPIIAGPTHWHITWAGP